MSIRFPKWPIAGRPPRRPHRKDLRRGRRRFLQGAGVSLALPWLEMFERPAHGQQNSLKRFIVLFFPNGAAADFWGPQGAGQGDAWGLSPILEPFAPLKSKMIALTNLENYTAMGDQPGIEPSHARASGAFLTCHDSDTLRSELRVDIANGVSFDQVLAQSLPRTTALSSLQTGLSTVESFCDGRHCSLSQSVSWASQTEPLYKEVNPQALFDTLVGSALPDGGLDDLAREEAERRQALDLSVLDAVLENATRTRARLGRDDRQRLDQFLESVRETELQVSDVTPPAAPSCTVDERPESSARYGLANNQEGYDRGWHAQVMNDLLVMALRCDATRIITHMFDDARSDFVYDHLENRRFTAEGSEADNGQVGGFHGLQHAGDSNNGYATINWWLANKASELCQTLDGIAEGEGSMLDNSVVLFGSGMHGSNHDTNELPIVLLGSGGGRLRTDQHIHLPAAPDERPLRDLYWTLAREVFDVELETFGQSVRGAQHQLLSEILV